ncbi:MAG: hypothetical protein VB070_06050 [Clostridiaceae bacterium]|nr:hypothetical protein [Clostridiaceae bacterium]
MEKESHRKIIIPMIQITLAGIVLMGLAYTLYALLHIIVTRVSLAVAATAIPTAYTRAVFALIMVLAYWLVSRTHWKDLYKSACLTVPTASLILAAGIGLYQWPAAAWAAKLVMLAFIMLFLYKARKTWMYFYAAAIAALVAMIY